MGNRLGNKALRTGLCRLLLGYATLARRDYAGSFVYLNGELERVELAEGYVDGSGGYHCYVRDAQGSVRAVVSAGDSVEETNHYYPYGALFGVSAMRGSAQPRKYGGNELERQYGLDMYDSRARWYDPLLCRATTPDPLAERTPAVSPYAWCAANPVRYTDPTGKVVKILGSPKNVNLTVEMLQHAAKSISLSYDSQTKALSYASDVSFDDFDAQSKIVANAIKNENATVNLRAIDGYKYNGKAIISGAYFGTNFDDKTGTAMSLNVINPQVLKEMDFFSEKGVSVLHELSESYISCLDAVQGKKSFLPSFVDRTAYDIFHNEATPQNEIVGYYFNSEGKKFLMPVSGIVRQEIHVLDRNSGRTHLIMNWDYKKYGRLE